MTTIDRSALLPYPAEAVFTLVADIERYPEFLPGCVEASILTRQENTVTARLTLSRAGISQSFTTRNTLVVAESMELVLVDGPFDQFSGRWTFKALSPEACKVALNLEFLLGGGLINAAAGKLFDRVAHDLVDAVVRRAQHVCGSPPP
ncbi:MAG: type II toxin-antitoxin system RatA family toxin [Cellvibrionales bacterium]|jgi:ribosome-associated toxin RatA of RatAB toxin-antitoxin module